MPRKRRKDVILSRAEQVEALASPVRHRIHLALEMLGPVSVRELAVWMEREPESLYYHIRRLVAVGVVVEHGSRRWGTREEKVYCLSGERVRLDPRQSSPAFLRGFARGARTLLRYASRCLVRALEDSRARRHGPSRNTRIEQVHIRLNAAKLDELHRRLDVLQAFLAENDDSGLDHALVVTVAVSPVFESGHSNSRD